MRGYIAAEKKKLYEETCAKLRGKGENGDLPYTQLPKQGMSVEHLRSKVAHRVRGCGNSVPMHCTRSGDLSRQRMLVKPERHCFVYSDEAKRSCCAWTLVFCWLIGVYSLRAMVCMWLIVGDEYTAAVEEA